MIDPGVVTSKTSKTTKTTKTSSLQIVFVIDPVPDPGVVTSPTSPQILLGTGC